MKHFHFLETRILCLAVLQIKATCRIFSCSTAQNMEPNFRNLLAPFHKMYSFSVIRFLCLISCKSSRVHMSEKCLLVIFVLFIVTFLVSVIIIYYSKYQSVISTDSTSFQNQPNSL